LARGEAARVEATGPAEIAPLIAELNRLLAAMSDRSRRSREALGNLAHGLKTQLAILRQVAESPELAANAPLREALQESVQEGYLRRQVSGRRLRR
ncbi:MAG TPA: hypothetical protein VFU53_05955, partial [Burkholderiales bacterium]|nr:hypothetical protein [Burkholderiales bacterium]